MSPFQKKITWIIALSAPAGLALMLSYAYAMFGSTLGQMLAGGGVIGPGLLAIAGLATLHGIYAVRLSRPLARQAAGESSDPVAAAQCVEEALRLPSRISLPFIPLYVISTAVVLLLIVRGGFHLPGYHVAVLLTAAFLFGTLVSVMQSNLIRRTVQEAVGQVLIRLPALIESHLSARARGIHSGILAVFTLILLVPLLLLLNLASVRMVETYGAELARAKYAELSNLAVLMREQAFGGGQQAVIDNLNLLEWKQATRVELRDRTGTLEHFSGADLEIDPAALEAITDPVAYASGLKQFNFPAQFDLLGRKDKINAFSYYSEQGWHWVAFESLGSEYMLVMAGDMRRHLPELGGFFAGMLLEVSIVFVVAVLIALLVSLNITQPVRSLTRVLEAVSRGNLTVNVAYYSHNELGWLAHTVARMRGGLARMISNVRSVVDTLNASKGAVESASAQILHLARQQAQMLEQASGELKRISTLVGSVASSASSLETISTEGSLSLQEMTATNRQAAQVAQDLSELASVVNSAIGEMAQSTKKIDENIANLFDLTERTSSAMIEIDASLIEVRDNVGETENMSVRLLEDADQGMSAVRSTREGIERIREVSRETRDTMDALKENAKKIGLILNVIDEVVDQTNLLSLNAAIIAAQAGEHGKGFAVVASEIKDLAKKTAESTGEIGGLIREVQERTFRAAAKVAASGETIDEGARLSGVSERALEKLLEGVKKTREWMKVIAQAANEQSKGGKEVTKSIETIVVMTDEIANATRVQDVKNEAITGEAERMQSIAGQLRVTTAEQGKTSALITQNIEKLAGLARTLRQSVDAQEASTRSIVEAEESMKGRAREQLEISTNLQKVVEELGDRSRNLEEELRQFKIE